MYLGYTQNVITLLLMWSSCVLVLCHTVQTKVSFFKVIISSIFRAITTNETMATVAEPIQNGTLQSEPLAADTILDPAANPSTEESDSAEKRWPGWPGHCVFRLIVPVLKVGIIIGRKGELIKKTCEETRARIRVLDAPVGTPDRIVSLPFQN
jgi:hypothetical protein